MIVIFVGGIGSGKSVSVIKELKERSKYSKAFINFETKGIKGVERIKIKDIIDEKEIEKGTKTVTKKVVNWQFWNEQKKKGRFSIYLDEVHNIMHSRMGMSKQNILLSMWIAQIRKVFGGQENDHLYVITQKLKRVDVSLRDLAEWIIECEKIKTKDGILIKKTFYHGSENYEYGIPSKATVFDPKSLFKHYDSYELIDFGNEVYL